MEEIMTQINHRPKGRIAVMVASHNEDTVRFCVEKWGRTVFIYLLLFDRSMFYCSDLLIFMIKYLWSTMVLNLEAIRYNSWILSNAVVVLCRMKDNSIGPQDRLICYGQLFGMCDHISFPLGKYNGTQTSLVQWYDDMLHDLKIPF